MAGVDFSLTERVIINPVLQLRATRSSPTISQRISDLFASEVIARVISLAASVFFAIDALTHELTAVYMHGHDLLRKCHCVGPAYWTQEERGVHCRKAAYFALLTLVGSVAGFIWPEVFKKIPRSPSLPPSRTSESVFPEVVNQLAVDMLSGKKKDSDFEQVWNRSDLRTRYWIVRKFNEDARFKAIRERLAPVVYQLVNPPAEKSLIERRVRWLNESEINTERQEKDLTNSAAYFHATSRAGLEAILKTRRVEVRHEKLYRVAFVSTQPEIAFGKYILVLKREIERLSSLEIGFRAGRAYWAGFSRDIPVEVNTLDCILVDPYVLEPLDELQKSCSDWAGREIQVLRLKNVETNLASVSLLNMGIPKEWGDKGEAEGQKILAAMLPQARVVIPRAMPVPTQRVSARQRVMLLA